MPVAPSVVKACQALPTRLGLGQLRCKGVKKLIKKATEKASHHDAQTRGGAHDTDAQAVAGEDGDPNDLQAWEALRRPVARRPILEGHVAGGTPVLLGSP